MIYLYNTFAQVTYIRKSIPIRYNPFDAVKVIYYIIYIDSIFHFDRVVPTGMLLLN